MKQTILILVLGLAVWFPGSGLALNMSSKIAVKSSEIRKETRGTRKMALREMVFLFSKTIFIYHYLSILRLCHAQSIKS